MMKMLAAEERENVMEKGGKSEGERKKEKEIRWRREQTERRSQLIENSITTLFISLSSSFLSLHSILSSTRFSSPFSLFLSLPFLFSLFLSYSLTSIKSLLLQLLSSFSSALLSILFWSNPLFFFFVLFFFSKESEGVELQSVFGWWLEARKEEEKEMKKQKVDEGRKWISSFVDCFKSFQIRNEMNLGFKWMKTSLNFFSLRLLYFFLFLFPLSFPFLHYFSLIEWPVFENRFKRVNEVIERQ